MVRKVVRRFDPGSLVAVDVETTGLLPWVGDRVFSTSLFNEEGNALYEEWPVDPETRDVLYDENQEGTARINRVLSLPEIAKVFHNSKFDVRHLERAEVFKFAGRVEDTYIAARCLRSNLPSYQLKMLAKQWADIPKDDETELKKIVQTARRIAGKLGWAKHEDLEADYWLPAAVLLHAPELVPEEAVREWRGANRKYNVRDTERTMILWLLMQELMEDEGVRHTYDFEMRKLWPVVYDMESRGWTLLPKELVEVIKKEKARQAKLEKRLLKVAPDVNFNSPKQLSKLLWDDLGLKHPDGAEAKSTNAKALEKVDNPFVVDLLAFRSVSKALSSFFLKYQSMSIPDHVEGAPADSLVLHPNFNQIGADTGRFSCKDGNVQNVPDLARTVSINHMTARNVFGPRPGYDWFMYDYSGLEVRIFCDFAGEKDLMKVILAGGDPHATCGNKAWGGKGNPSGIRMMNRNLKMRDVKEVVKLAKEFGVTIKKPARQSVESWHSEISEAWLAAFDYDIVVAEAHIGLKSTRTMAKMLLFLKLFGGGKKSASELIRCSIPEAAGFLIDYERAVPTIKPYQRKLIVEAQRDGYIKTAYNRKLMIDRRFAYRCVNYKVQGSAADLIKDKMVEVDRYCRHLRSLGYEWYLIGSIHDELVLEGKREHQHGWIIAHIRDLMEDNDKRFGVFLEVHCDKASTNWQDAQEIIIPRAA